MSRQLLIIDDDRAIHNLVSTHLDNSQTECISALDGADGLRRAAEVRPSAILLDMDMPDMDGVEVCRRLKANPRTRSIPILFLTGDRSTRSKVQGMDMGAVDYVTKPFDPFELRARVRSAFRTAHAIESHQTLAGIDESTGIWNRAYACKQIESLVASGARNKQLVNCCLVSIDRFDELAGKMGHPGGADLVRDAAEAISAAVRLNDVVCRYDTSTIAVLGLAPDRPTSRILAERICDSIGEIGLRSFVEPEAVTCSVGLSISRASVGPVILHTAEQALIEAQMDGNRIVLLSADVIESALERQPIN